MKFLKYTLIVFLFSFSSCDPAALQSVLDTTLGEEVLSETDIANGLKQALEIGIGNGSEKLSQLDGYFQSPYKVLMPEEAQTVINKLKFIPGFSDLEEKLVLRMNRAAEDAASKAAPIFIDAIKGMSFSDATNILMGDKNAATSYLKDKTFQSLYSEFQPVILKSMEDVYAQQLWEEATTAYNKIPLVNKVDTKLDRHVTNKAMDGLFSMVEKEEKAIRQDVSKRVTSLLQKVFAKQD